MPKDELLSGIDSLVEESKTEQPMPQKQEMDFDANKQPIQPKKVEQPKPQQPKVQQPQTGSPNKNVEMEYKQLSDEAIKLFNKGQKLSPDKQKRYDELKAQMSNLAKVPVNQGGLKQPKPNHSAKFDELIKHAHNTFEPEYKGAKAAEGFIQDYEFGNMDENYDSSKNYKLTDEEKSYIIEQFKKLRPDYSDLTDDELEEELYDNEYWYGNARNEEELAKWFAERTKISPERAREFIGKHYNGGHIWDMEKPSQAAYEVALGLTGDTSKAENIQKIVDDQLAKFGRIGAGLYDELDQAGYYLDENNKVRSKNEIRYDKIVYPKGTSKEYTEKVNAEYQKALPILQKYGIKLEDFGGRSNDRGGYEDNTKAIMDKYVFGPFRAKYPYGDNDAWNREYKELYDAIQAVEDKNYNDWWIRNK